MSEARSRDESVDIAKGIGIILVVGGHCNFEIPDLPSYSFHMPLFYFISGFFLNKYFSIYSFSSLSFIKKKFYDLLVPYFIYNIIFGVITYFISFININFAIKTFFSAINFNTLFIEPFFSGHQFQISCPLWFVPSLFLVFVIVSITNKFLIMFMGNNFLKAILSLIMIFIYYISIHFQSNTYPYFYVVFRTLAGYSFCVLGMIFYTYRQRLNYIYILLLSIAIFGYLTSKHGPQGFSSLYNSYGNGSIKYLSFFYSISGILIVISISNIISIYRRFVSPNDIAFLGKYSFHIMAVHLSAFLILNIIIATIAPHKNISDISSIYFRYNNLTWVYFLFSMTLSYYYVKFINHINKKIVL